MGHALRSSDGHAPVHPQLEVGRRRLRVVTRCASVEEFIVAFGPFTEETSVFVVTTAPRPVGPRQPFVIQLRDGTPVLRGEGEIVESIHDPAAPIRGMRLKLLALDDEARAMHNALLARGALLEGDAPPPPEVTSTLPRAAPAVEIGERAPRAAAELPANPFESLTEEALEAFVDCTLYEDRAGGPAAEHTNDGVALDASAPEVDGTAGTRERSGLHRFRTAGAHAIGAAGLTPRVAKILAGSVAVTIAVTLVAGYGIWGGRADPASPSQRVEAAAAGEQARVPSPAPVVAPAAAPADAPPKRCTANVRSDPPGAGVVWNGVKLGQTPLDAAPVACEPAMMALEHDEFERLEKRVSPLAGHTVFLFERLRRPAVSLDITTEPPGAKVAVRGRFIGRAPMSTVVFGHTEIEVVASLAGHRPTFIKVTPRPPSAKAHLVLQALPKPGR